MTDTRIKGLPIEPELDLSPYAGRYVALMGKRVAGVGASAADAQQAAKRSRPKEEPSAVVWVPAAEDAADTLAQRISRLFAADTLAGRVRVALLARAGRVYLVGGLVRDLYLGRESHDLDLAVPAGALALAREVANALHAAYYALDETRGTGRIVFPDGTSLDVATFQGEDLEADLAGRDFTINAMAIDLASLELIDRHAGVDDCERRLVRLVRPDGIRRDPIRALRGLRQATELGFQVEPSSEALFARDGAGLPGVSNERIRDEMFRLLELPDAAGAVGRADRLGLWRAILPELRALHGVGQSLPHHLDVWEHTLLALSRLEHVLTGVAEGYSPQPALMDYLDLARPILPALRRYLAHALGGGRSLEALLKLAALLHDIGKPACRRQETGGRVRFLGHDVAGSVLAEEIGRRLRLSTAEAAYLRDVVRGHMRPLLLTDEPAITPRAAHRFFRDAQTAGLGITLLALADAWAMRPGQQQPLRERRLLQAVADLQRYALDEDGPEGRPPLLNGHDLLALGLEGPAVGRWLRRTRERQVAGELRDREEALHWVGEALGRVSGEDTVS